MQLIRIEVEATYPYRLPEKFGEALKESIAQHLKAYGCAVRKIAFDNQESEGGLYPPSPR